MTNERLKKLQKHALAARRTVISMATGGGCFVGASLSCTDLFISLYFSEANINPNNKKNPDRDYVLLSKGHAVPAWYAVLAEAGFFDRNLLKDYMKPGSHLYLHPNTHIPGIEFHAGSLGQTLAVAAGIAYDQKVSDNTGRVFVILGDGELNEGSIWETLLFIAAKKLNNLVIIIDRNELQANFTTEEVIPIEPIPDKFTAFGFSCLETDGHDFEKLEEAFALARGSEKPAVIIAKTVRGKGIPGIERRADKWFMQVTEHERDQLIRELEQQESR
ncbi:MAG: transketolase [Spirochaetales bacterium]|nr:transketolase [Spirochaetales bacterium]